MPLPVIAVEGRLTADPELRFTPAGIAVASFTVVASDRAKNPETDKWEDKGEPLFLRCSVWRQQAEHVAESLTKGDQVLVTGKLQQRSYETREGEKRTVVEMTAYQVAASLQFHAIKSNRAERASQGQAPESDPWASGGASDDEPPF